MKKNIGFIILGILLSSIAIFLMYIIVSKQNISKEEFNLKVGQVIKFKDDDISAEVLNVASTLCKTKKCKLDGEIEVSLKVKYAGNISYYKLQSVSNPVERIENSNYNLILNYANNEINIDIKSTK